MSLALFGSSILDTISAKSMKSAFLGAGDCKLENGYLQLVCMYCTLCAIYFSYFMPATFPNVVSSFYNLRATHLAVRSVLCHLDLP